MDKMSNQDHLHILSLDSEPEKEICQFSNGLTHIYHQDEGRSAFHNIMCLDVLTIGTLYDYGDKVQHVCEPNTSSFHHLIRL